MSFLRLCGCVVVVLFAGSGSVACGGDDGSDVPAADDSGASAIDDRERFNDEVDGVRAVIADCFVKDTSDNGRRYSTTVEVFNDSSVAHTVTVTIEADSGRGGVSEAFDVPAAATDAWAVQSAEETVDPVGDVECPDYITGVEVTVDP